MKLLVFDLDGTLTNSAPGITRSVQYALDRMGYPKQEQALLETFVGPPLGVRFREAFGMDDERALEAVNTFRERYHTIGKFENEVYPGIHEMIPKLKDAGYLLAIATSKPEVMAIEITEHFDLRRKFDYLCGATLDESKINKPDIIEEVLRISGFSDRRGEVMMIGDTRYDMEGARQTGLTAVGVSYGYGARADLEKSGADRIVDSVAELEALLLGWKE